MAEIKGLVKTQNPKKLNLSKKWRKIPVFSAVKVDIRIGRPHQPQF